MIGILTDAPLRRGIASDDLVTSGLVSGSGVSSGLDSSDRDVSGPGLSGAGAGLVAEVEPRTEEGSALDVRSLPAPTSDQMVQLFKLLADETRLQILYFLTQKLELNVGTFCDLLDQSQPAVSHHLALMRGAGLLEMRREGKHNFYRLKPSRFQEFGQVLYSALPSGARDWHWAALADAAAGSATTDVAGVTGNRGV